jgi:hypothetical protein
MAADDPADHRTDGRRRKAALADGVADHTSSDSTDHLAG